MRFVVLSLLFAPLALAPARATDSFRVEELAPGVQLFRPASEAHSGSNSLVVDRDDGLLVVGAQPSPGIARKLLAAIAEHSEKQVRYLILPHSHAEAAGGATAFPESTLVIGSQGCVESLEDQQYDFGAEARVRAADPSSWTEPPRRLPALVPLAKTTLRDSRNVVELLPFSRSHSAGDMAVYLPGSDIFFAGAFVFPDRSPDGDDADIGKWVAALNHLIRQGPRIVVPLRGPVQDVASLRPQRDSLAWLRAKITEGMMDRLPIDEIRERVLEAEDIGERFDIESPFLPRLVERATQQAWDTRAKIQGK
jgi:glyoxylase-like metal-dependent hydrolase (beta-lactamase superfamily II)